MTRSFLTSLTAFAFAVLIVFGTTIAVTAQTNFYTDRATFEADFPGLALEDFEEGMVGAGGVVLCDEPVNSASNDACFVPGDIIPDVDFRSSSAGGMVILGSGIIGNASIVLGPNFFADSYIINMTGTTFAAGMDLWVGADGTVDVNVFDGPDGTGALLGSTSVAVTGGVGQFTGVESSSLIGSIILEETAGGGEVIDDFSMSDVPIPVELVSFDAVVNGTDVSLNWETASETNNAGFEVQILDGEDWNALGFVEGNGTTTEAQTYHFTIQDMSVGTHTFRLKQIDFDGQFEYHGDVEVTVETPGTHLITRAYPNPFNPQSQFTLAVAQDQRVTAELYNTLGQRVSTLFNGTVEANQAQLVTIDGAGLASGMYVVRVTGERFADALRVTLLK